MKVKLPLGIPEGFVRTTSGWLTSSASCFVSVTNLSNGLVFSIKLKQLEAHCRGAISGTVEKGSETIHLINPPKSKYPKHLKLTVDCINCYEIVETKKVFRLHPISLSFPVIFANNVSIPVKPY